MENVQYCAAMDADSLTASGLPNGVLDRECPIGAITMRDRCSCTDWFQIADYGRLNTASLETADARITTGSESGAPVGEWFCRRCPGGCCSATRKEADEDCR
jgi:hypothetical protein